MPGFEIARPADGEVEPLGGLTTQGLPWPASSDPANQGANDIKALALAVDGKLPVAFSQSVTAGALPSGLTTYPLNVPIGKLVLVNAIVTWRLNAAGQYGNIQWFDAGVMKGASAGVQAPGGTTGAATGATAILVHKFAGAPTFNIFCSNAMTVDSFVITGLIFG